MCPRIFFSIYHILLDCPKIWRYGKEHGIISQPDYFAAKYNSRAMGIIVAIVGSLAIVPYICIQMKGLGIIV